MKHIRMVCLLLTVIGGASVGLVYHAERLGRAATAGSANRGGEAHLAFAVYQVEQEPINDEDSKGEAAPNPTELSIDDGSYEIVVGLDSPGTIVFVNRLRPPSYPATLSQLKIFFANGPSNLHAGSPITLLVGTNPDGDENINGTSFEQVTAFIQGLDHFNRFTVPPLTIHSGDFLVGFRIQVSANVFPGVLDTTPPSHRRSYLSTDGFSFRLTEDRGSELEGNRGNWGIRAFVTTQPRGLAALVASFRNSKTDDKGTGDITILGDLSEPGLIAGHIVTQGVNSEVIIAPNGRYGIAFPTGKGNSISLITHLDKAHPSESRVMRVGQVPSAVAITPDSRTAIVVNGFSRPVTYRIISGLPNAPRLSNPLPIPDTRKWGDDSGAEDVALSPSGDTAIISLFQDDEVAVIDGVQSGSPTVRAKVSVSPGPNGIAFAPDGNTAFVVGSRDESISVVSGLLPGHAPFFVRRIRKGVGDGPHAIGLTPDGAKAVVTCREDNNLSIFRVNGKSLSLLRKLDVGSAPAGLAISADGRTALVANSKSRTLSVIRGLDTSTPFIGSTLGPSASLDTARFAERSVALAPVPTSGPVLNVAPSTLTFNAVVGAGNPPSQHITVHNSGRGTFTFNLSSSDTSLVIASPSVATVVAGQTLTVNVMVTTPRGAGTRTAFLTVNAPGAENSPQVVTITVTTANPPASLAVSPSTLTFNPVVNLGNPPSQQVFIHNTGSGLLTFNISTSDSSLVNVAPVTGVVFGGQFQAVTVFATNPNVIGTRTAFLVVNAPEAHNSPQTVTVTVNTGGPPAVLNVFPTTLTFHAVVGQGNPASQHVTVQNAGASPLSFTVSSNSGMVLVTPTGGTLLSGQARSIQVTTINPNTPGTIHAQLTVTAPGAQNSPQVINVTLNTQAGSGQDVNEPNDNPQSSTLLTPPALGQSVTISGNGKPNDPGTNVNQLNSECRRNGLVQDWFRLVVSRRATFQVSLSFQRPDVDFDLWWFIQSNDFLTFPQGVQLFAFSAQGPGQQEALGARVLEPGTYFIGVSRVRRNAASDFQRVGYSLRLTRGSSPELHAIEDVACAGFIVGDPGTNGLFVVNRVRPSRFPARLETISALFFPHPGQPSPTGRPVRIIAFIDPWGSGTPPFNPPLVIDQTVFVNLPPDGRGRFTLLNLGTNGPVISQGDFYVGYLVDTPNGIFPDSGRALNPSVRSFASNDRGRTYRQLNIQGPGNQLLNVAIRATVNTTPFGNSALMSEPTGHRQLTQDIEMIRPRTISVEPR